ncbi:SDR family NAD(P)-dependent oxidoreductase [Sphingomonas sp. BIUV-7]|uniref:SDR family NAD(P)-dependent oxidoreductase n=1 Tax=Sphingomonas natans TaxID=3063330 RepID=A0ABT8Y750_9SPHN|nr:SDR family NAD(P)-dependent oxidoreductase [Sphingomonas sp. BIUV-7]MDO6414126.1 SDR family NAD(P)-dependent oxidoreductase [Sphingomonas sp. BIUV-7]
MVDATAVVIGAGGGIGGALVEALAASGRYTRIYALSRHPRTNEGRIVGGAIDVVDEASIRNAAERIDLPLDLVVIATGILHEDGRMPEKALRELDGSTLARLFELNMIGPALALKHFAPLLAKDRRAVIAALSARVGSISDNRTGGWYGYRASKAALNMIMKCAAIEIARSRPQALCVALHPGTVDTDLSQPFQRGVPPDQLFSPGRAARHLLDVLADLDPASSGKIFAWDGSEIFP